MIDCPEEIKELWKNDSIKKNFRVRFLNDTTKPDLTNKDIVSESVSFTESLCSQGNIHFGLSEASTIEFETVNVSNIAGERIACYIEIDLSSLPAILIANWMDEENSLYDQNVTIVDDIYDDEERSVPVYRMIYGIFTVDECKRSQSNLKHRQITGYSTQLSEELRQVGLIPKRRLTYTQTDLFNAITLIKEDMTQLPVTSASSNPVTPCSKKNFDVAKSICTAVTFTGIEQKKFETIQVASTNTAVVFRGEFEIDDYDYTNGDKAYKKALASKSYPSTTFTFKKTTQTKYTTKKPAGVQSDLYYPIYKDVKQALTHTIGFLKPFYRVIAHYNYTTRKNNAGVGTTYSYDRYSFDYTFEPYSNVIVDFANIRFPRDLIAKNKGSNNPTSWEIEIFVPTKWNNSASWRYSLNNASKVTTVKNWPITTTHTRSGSINVYYKTFTKTDSDATITIEADQDPYFTLPNNAGSTYLTFDDSPSFLEIVNGYLELRGVFGDFNRKGSYGRKELVDTVVMDIGPEDYEEFWFDDYTTEPVGKVLYPSANYAVDEDGNLLTGDDAFDIHSVKISSGRRSYDMSSNTYLRNMDFPSVTLLQNTIDPDDLPVSTDSKVVFPNSQYISKYKKELMNLYIKSIVTTDFAETGADITYIPFELTMKALPYIEKGDKLRIRTKDGVYIESFALRRTLKGIQHIVDSITCEGENFTYTTGHSGTEVKTEPDVENAFIKIYSSKGTIFKNNQVQTVLSVVVTKGNVTCTNSLDFSEAFGDKYYLQWQMMLNTGAYLTIKENDPRVGDNGFTLTVSPSDVYNSTKFRCNLVSMTDDELNFAVNNSDILANAAEKPMVDHEDRIITMNVLVYEEEDEEGRPIPTIKQYGLYAYTQEGEYDYG